MMNGMKYCDVIEKKILLSVATHFQSDWLFQQDERHMSYGEESESLDGRPWSAGFNLGRSVSRSQPNG
jgi:hypothetical protein